MTKLEQHRKIWQGKSDEWLFERLANELTQKVEEIHRLLAENEQLRLSSVVKPKGTFCQTPDNCQMSYYQQIGDYYCSKCEKTGLV